MSSPKLSLSGLPAADAINGGKASAECPKPSRQALRDTTIFLDKDLPAKIFQGLTSGRPPCFAEAHPLQNKAVTRVSANKRKVLAEKVTPRARPASEYRRKHLPCCVRPARPARCVASGRARANFEACTGGAVSSVAAQTSTTRARHARATREVLTVVRRATRLDCKHAASPRYQDLRTPRSCGATLPGHRLVCRGSRPSQTGFGLESEPRDPTSSRRAKRRRGWALSDYIYIYIYIYT